MRATAILVPLALALTSAPSCVDGDLAGTEASHCTPGRQTTCACGGGVEGFQVCRDDGSGFGACVCNDAAPADSVTVDVSTPDSTSSTPDTSAPLDTATVDTATVDTATVDTAKGPSWVWIDRGGPAYQPASCPDGPGVMGGKLVDPEAFFAALIKGKPASDWMKVMNDIEPSLWACGLGQQRDSSGTVRGRLFLPNAACPNAAPPSGDAVAIKLGVRQEPDCWTHAVDVVDGGS